MTEKEKKELFEKLQSNVEQFHEETKDLCKDLSDAVSLIDAGGIPSAASCTDLVGKVTSVKALRKLCESSYKQFGHNALPESFDELSDEVQRIESLLDKSVYIEAKDFLLRLVVHDEKVAVLFEQLKKDLLSIDIDALAIDQCQSMMSKYVDLKNLLTAPAIDKAGYMLKIGSEFDSRILSLAFTGEYDISETAASVDDAADMADTGSNIEVDAAANAKAVDSDESLEAESQIVADVVDIEEDAEELTDASLESLLDDDDDDDWIDVDDFIVDSYTMSTAELMEKFNYYPESIPDIEVVEKKSGQAGKSFSVKKFKDGLKNNPLNTDVLAILGYMSLHIVMLKDTKDELTYEEIKNQKVIDGASTALDYLYKKGYIKYLSSEGYPTICTFSQKGRDLMSNKTACDMILCDKMRYYTISAKPVDYLTALLRTMINKCLKGTNILFDRTKIDSTIAVIDDGTAYIAMVPDSEDKLSYILDTIAYEFEENDIAKVNVFECTKERAKAACKILACLKDSGILAEDVKFIPHYCGESIGNIANVLFDKKNENEPQDMKEASGKGDNGKKRDIPAEKKEKTTTDTNGKNDLKKKDADPADAEAEPQPKAKATSLKKTDNEIISVREKIEGFINDNKLCCATAYAGAAALKNPNCSGLYNRLAYAINDPAAHCTYTSESLFNIYSDFGAPSDYYYQVSASMRLFYAGQGRYDYNLQAIHDSINGSPALQDNSSLNDLIYNLRKFREKNGYAVDRYADYRSRDRVELEKELGLLKSEAASYYENDFINQRMMYTKTINRRYEVTWKEIFSRDGDFGTYVNAVSEDNTGYLELAKDYLAEQFIKDDMPVAAENIDVRKIDELIDNVWNNVVVTDKVALLMKSTTLMGSMRNNFRQHILKSVTVVANWVVIHEVLGDEKDEAYAAYASIKSKLLSLADDAVATAMKKLDAADPSTMAGITVLVRTIMEIRAKIDGSYSMADQKYFYLDFLKHNHVILGEDYLPEYECSVPTISEMDMMRLVEKHAAADERTIEQNLDSYCKDNFRSAKLILEYLQSKTGTVPEISETLPEAEKYAEGQLEIIHREFVSDLELAQSYGQLDADDAEDKKDQILRIADKWYAWADDTHNFGFYKDLLAEMREQIKSDAAGRGKNMTKQLESLLAENSALERDYAEYIDRIRKTIDKQNYLVAEDMINHLLNGDIPQDTELFEDDYLADFQSRYSYYYKLAGGSGQALANQVRANDLKALSNKDQKGAIVLKNSWPNPGRTVSPENLRNILNTLGIEVDKIALSDAANSIFSVKVKKPAREDEKSYGHPVYGFGSKAAKDGFRVIWLSGSYNADALINKFSEFGKSKHTIAFLDHSLSESERRRLAKKIKEAGSSKIFAVIDRVLYMYLIHNYSETYIGRMLMECMMPYAYFQPYIYDSATVMPPEMFMGRKNELEKIMDPAGVSIVYGGRQLGKSALLRKAKADINGADTGEKAILIDIKDLDYIGTAKKVAQTLFDEHIIDEPVKNETDWNEIARAVKNTLNGSRKIRYLLLMLDEADAFLESCEQVGYSPFNALKDIQQSVDSGRFKFVVAGLRNVVRFNKAATSGNSVLPHLESLVIKPFNAQEARMLLEQPLYYLGFRFPEDNTDLVPMILATANYFPGLVQLYCARLIEALKKNYGDYDEAMTPPYVIEEGLIKRVLAESEFRNQIREKFMITLTVGDDDYYYILALILAFLYRNYEREDGYTSSEILDVAKEFHTKRISEMTTEQIDALMTELTELNVLRVTAGGKYLFSRYNFLSMMGTSAEIDEKLLSYAE